MLQTPSHYISLRDFSGEILPVSFHHFNGTSLLSLTQQVKQINLKLYHHHFHLREHFESFVSCPVKYVTILWILAVDIHILSVTKNNRNLYFQVIRLSWKHLKEVLKEDKLMKLIKFSFKYLKSN